MPQKDDSEEVIGSSSWSFYLAQYFPGTPRHGFLAISLGISAVHKKHQAYGIETCFQ